MKRKKQHLLLILLVLGVCFCLYTFRLYNGIFSFGSSVLQRARGKPPTPSEIVIAVVACGQRLDETLTMIKSALLFHTSPEHLKFIIITEDQLMIGFREKLEDWQKLLRNSFSFVILPLSLPDNNSAEWKNLFKPCAAQRLFLPSLLKDIDSVLYMDTDTIFVSPIIDIWSYFKKFNSSQIAALSPEHEDSNVGWYNRFARHPFYGPLGLNSGVMLMNLTRMRDFQWVESILPIYNEYKLKITWGDQDLINILFYYHPDKLHVFPCPWNYRPDHCIYMSVCKAADGIKIVHGNRGYFHADKQPAFKALYTTIQQYNLGSDPYHNYLQPLERSLSDTNVVNSNCGRPAVAEMFVQVARGIFKQTEYEYNNS